jgi:hypothetical protein
VNQERLAAACRLLIDSGDLTPMGERMLLQINAAELETCDFTTGNAWETGCTRTAGHPPPHITYGEQNEYD